MPEPFRKIPLDRKPIKLEYDEETQTYPVKSYKKIDPHVRKMLNPSVEVMQPAYTSIYHQHAPESQHKRYFKSLVASNPHEEYKPTKDDTFVMFGDDRKSKITFIKKDKDGKVIPSEPETPPQKYEKVNVRAPKVLNYSAGDKGTRFDLGAKHVRPSTAAGGPVAATPYYKGTTKPVVIAKTSEKSAPVKFDKARYVDKSVHLTYNIPETYKPKYANFTPKEEHEATPAVPYSKRQGYKPPVSHASRVGETVGTMRPRYSEAKRTFVIDDLKWFTRPAVPEHPDEKFYRLAERVALKCLETIPDMDLEFARNSDIEFRVSIQYPLLYTQYLEQSRSVLHKHYDDEVHRVAAVLVGDQNEARSIEDKKKIGTAIDNLLSEALTKVSEVDLLEDIGTSVAAVLTSLEANADRTLQSIRIGKAIRDVLLKYAPEDGSGNALAPGAEQGTAATSETEGQSEALAPAPNAAQNAEQSEGHDAAQNAAQSATQPAAQSAGHNEGRSWAQVVAQPAAQPGASISNEEAESTAPVNESIETKAGEAFEQSPQRDIEIDDIPFQEGDRFLQDVFDAANAGHALLQRDGTDNDTLRETARRIADKIIGRSQPNAPDIRLAKIILEAAKQRGDFARRLGNKAALKYYQAYRELGKKHYAGERLGTMTQRRFDDIVKKYKEKAIQAVEDTLSK